MSTHYMMQKIGFTVLGLLIALFAFLTWSFVSLSKVVSSDHLVLAQIVNLINQSQQKSSTASALPVK